MESRSRVANYGSRMLGHGLRLAGYESNNPQPATRGLQPLTRYLLWLGAALLLALIVFSNTLANGFVYDDHYLIINNRSLQDEDYLSRVFTPAPQDSPVTGSAKTNAGFVAYYRPFTRALFAINYRLFGLEAIGWHAVNLALYITVVALVFFLLVRITRRIEIAGPATLLFALHPIHSETVSWANCLVETLHALFFLISFLLFVWWRQSEHRHNWLLFIGSILAAMCAILSKETAISLPILAAGYILFVEERSDRLSLRIQNALFATVPYMTVIALYLLLRYNAGGGNLVINNAGNLGVTLRSLPAVSVKYLSLLLLPINLSPAYPVRPIDSFLNPHFLIPAVILIALTAIVARYYFRNTLFRSGLLLLVVPLAPLLNVGMLLPELMIQDRYLFLPSIGFCLLGGLLYAALPERGKLPRRAILLLLLACYAAIAIKQNTYWRDDRALFTRALEIDPKSSISHVNLAGAYSEAGDMAAAEREYTAALRYDPDCAICFANIGQIRYKRGERQQAVAFYREAIRCGYSDSNILHEFAVGLMEIGEVDQGIKTFEQVAALEPDSPVALSNVGQAYLVGGESRRAIEWLERAVALESENAERHFLLGVAYEQADLGENAIIHYRIALKIKPDYKQASDSLKRLENNKTKDAG